MRAAKRKIQEMYGRFGSCAEAVAHEDPFGSAQGRLFTPPEKRLRSR